MNPRKFHHIYEGSLCYGYFGKLRDMQAKSTHSVTSPSKTSSEIKKAVEDSTISDEKKVVDLSANRPTQRKMDDDLIDTVKRNKSNNKYQKPFDLRFTLLKACSYDSFIKEILQYEIDKNIEPFLHHLLSERYCQKNMILDITKTRNYLKLLVFAAKGTFVKKETLISIFTDLLNVTFVLKDFKIDVPLQINSINDVFETVTTFRLASYIAKYVQAEYIKDSSSPVLCSEKNLLDSIRDYDAIYENRFFMNGFLLVDDSGFGDGRAVPFHQP